MRVFDEAAEMQYLTINEKISDTQKLEKRILKIENKLSQSKHMSGNTFSPGNVDTLCNVDIQHSCLAGNDICETKTPKQSERPFTAEKLKNGNGKQPENNNRTEAISTATVTSEQKTVLYQSPISKRIRRIPVADIQNQTDSFCNVAVPFRIPITQTTGDLINFSSVASLSRKSVADNSVSVPPVLSMTNGSLQGIPRSATSSKHEDQNNWRCQYDFSPEVSATVPGQQHYGPYASATVLNVSKQTSMKECNNSVASQTAAAEHSSQEQITHFSSTGHE